MLLLARLPELGPHLASPGVFLVLRRMRTPLVVLIIIFVLIIVTKVFKFAIKGK